MKNFFKKLKQNTLVFINKISKNKFNRIVYVVGLSVLLFGIIIPELLSDDSTINVIFGFVLAFVFGRHVGGVLFNTFKN